MPVALGTGQDGQDSVRMAIVSQGERCCKRVFERERVDVPERGYRNCDYIFPSFPPSHLSSSLLHLSPPMLSARSVDPLPLSDRLPFPSSTPRPPAQSLDVAMDILPSPSHNDASTTPPQLPSTQLSTSGQVSGFLSTFRLFSQPQTI